MHATPELKRRERGASNSILTVPRLIVICGPPCSGKSWLAARIARRLAMVHLEMDDFRKRLPASKHPRREIDLAYRAMHGAAQVILGAGYDVVLDACYGRWRQRADVQSLARRTRVRFFLVQCRVSKSVARSRFSRRSRNHPAHDLTVGRVALLAGRYAYCTQGLVLDTSKPRAREFALAVSSLLKFRRTAPIGQWSRCARRWRDWPGPRA
jgi:predicted kinase